MEQCEVRGAADPARGAGDAKGQGAAGVWHHGGNMVRRLFTGAAPVKAAVQL